MSKEVDRIKCPHCDGTFGQPTTTRLKGISRMGFVASYMVSCPGCHTFLGIAQS